jgi:hypothetical protein
MENIISIVALIISIISLLILLFQILKEEINIDIMIIEDKDLQKDENNI